MKSKSIFKTCGAFALSAIMAFSMFSVTAFAATDDATRQANSSATATVDLEKTLTVNQANKFPNVSDFTFTFERIKAWDNANVSTAQNGTAIAKADIPMPAVSDTAHHTISAVNADKVTVTTGDYSQSATGDTATSRTRNTPLQMTYNKAGYYIYKVNEVNSGVAGITYDSDAYYVAVYVANNQDAQGNTVAGVYVHSITIWENIPSEAAIGNVNSGQDIGTNTDNAGDNAAKKSVTTETNPDETTVNFDNLSSSNDVVISKNVKGSLGDKTKQFEFTVTMTGLVAGTAYDISGNGTLVSASTGTLDTTGKTITPDANGNATFLVKLTDDQNVKIEALPVGATYRVNEAASDHIASFATTSDATGTTRTDYVEVNVADMDETKAYFYDNEGQNEVDQGNVTAGTEVVYEAVQTTVGGAVIAQASGANTAKETALQCGQETVDATDGTVTVAYTNQRDIATITGVPGLDYMLYGLIALMMAGAAGLIIKRRKTYADELNA